MRIFLSMTTLFFLILSVQVYAQLQTIKEFPKVYKSQVINDLTPVWISGNEILALYTNEEGDTLFSRRTTNLGQSWSNQKVEQVLGEYEKYLSEILLQKVSNGRLILMWKHTDGAAIISYSDDGGRIWTNTIQTGVSVDRARYFSLTELNEDELLLVYEDINWRTRISTNNGITWSSQDYFVFPFPPPLRRGSLHIVKLSENADTLLGIINRPGNRIWSMRSTNSGDTWTDTTRIINVSYSSHPFTLKVLQDINE